MGVSLTGSQPGVSGAVVAAASGEPLAQVGVVEEERDDGEPSGDDQEGQREAAVHVLNTLAVWLGRGEGL